MSGVRSRPSERRYRFAITLGVPGGLPVAQARAGFLFHGRPVSPTSKGIRYLAAGARADIPGDRHRGRRDKKKNARCLPDSNHQASASEQQTRHAQEWDGHL
jgi:hypothetical protein